MLFSLILPQNYPVSFRFIHPGRWDAEIFFNSILHRFLDGGNSALTVKDVSEAWQEYLLNRINSAQQRVAPMDYRTTITTSNEAYLQKVTRHGSDMADQVKLLQDKVADLESRPATVSSPPAATNRRTSSGRGGRTPRRPKYSAPPVGNTAASTANRKFDDTEDGSICWRFNMPRKFSCLYTVHKLSLFSFRRLQRSQPRREMFQRRSLSPAPV